MFLHAAVILSNWGGGVRATHASLPCMPPATYFTPATHSPCHAWPPAMHTPTTHGPHDMVSERVVRILLECILVIYSFSSVVYFSYNNSGPYMVRSNASWVMVTWDSVS